MLPIKNSEPIDEVCDIKYAKTVSEVGFKMLAMAVIRQAAKDQAEGFFYSEHFKMFMPDFDGPALWKQIEENYRNSNGKRWFAQEGRYYNDT